MNLRIPLRALAVATCVFVTISTESFAGGQPSLSVDAAPKAFDRASEGAFVLVSVAQCGAPANIELEARAEGVVDGERQSLRLDLRSTSRLGTYAVKRTWPARGRWTLFFVADRGGEATAVVQIPGAKGAATRVTTHARRLSRGEIEAIVAGEERTARL